MHKIWLFLVLLLAGYFFQGCSTTEQQVEQNIEALAANSLESDAWQQGWDQTGN